MKWIKPVAAASILCPVEFSGSRKYCFLYRSAFVSQRFDIFKLLVLTYVIISYPYLAKSGQSPSSVFLSLAIRPDPFNPFSRLYP